VNVILHSSKQRTFRPRSARFPCASNCVNIVQFQVSLTLIGQLLTNIQYLQLTALLNETVQYCTALSTYKLVIELVQLRHLPMFQSANVVKLTLDPNTAKQFVSIIQKSSFNAYLKL